MDYRECRDNRNGTLLTSFDKGILQGESLDIKKNTGYIITPDSRAFYRFLKNHFVKKTISGRF